MFTFIVSHQNSILNEMILLNMQYLGFTNLITFFKLFGDYNEDVEGLFFFTLPLRSWLHGSVQRNQQVRFFSLGLSIVYHHHHHLCPLRPSPLSQGGVQSGQRPACRQHPQLCPDSPFSSRVLPPSPSPPLHSSCPALPPAALPPFPGTNPAHPGLHGWRR